MSGKPRFVTTLTPRTVEREVSTGVDPVEFEKVKRQLAELTSERDTLKAQVAKSDDEIRTLKAAADTSALDRFLTDEAVKGRVLKPGHAVRLVGDQYEVVNGKVQVKGKPDIDPAKHFADWIGSDEGKYLVSSTIPEGSGAKISTPVPASKPIDLSTPEGMTAYVRSGNAGTPPPK